MAKADSRHRCVARGCQKTVPGDKLMCLLHWRLVPVPIQRRVWAHYRRGQESDGQHTAAYAAAVRDAIRAVANGQDRPADDDGPSLFS